MARNSENIADAIQGVNGIVYTQATELNTLKSVARNKASSANTSIGLGLTEMSVGDVIKVLAVDDNGIPTAWGKEAGAWRTIAEITTTTDVGQYEITQDINGNSFELSEVIMSFHYEGTLQQYQLVYINGVNVSFRHANNTLYQTLLLRKIGNSLYGLNTGASDKHISDMDNTMQGNGVYFNLFPNDEKITSIKFGTYQNTSSSYAYTVTILGR